MKFIRRKEVENRTGLSRSSIYKRMSDGTFPKQQKIGQRAVAWVEDDVDKWMCSCISENSYFDEKLNPINVESNFQHKLNRN